MDEKIVSHFLGVPTNDFSKDVNLKKLLLMTGKRQNLNQLGFGFTKDNRITTVSPQVKQSAGYFDYTFTGADGTPVFTPSSNGTSSSDLSKFPDGSKLTKAIPDSVRQWEPFIQKYSAKHGIDPNFVRAILWSESHGFPKRVSPCGAAGLMQFMLSTAKGMHQGKDQFIGIKNGIPFDGRFDPEKAIDYGALYLKQKFKEFGTFELAAAAYNAGSGAVRKWHGIPPYKETRNYVKLVIARMGVR